MIQRVLVTGSAGRIGRAAVAAIVAPWRDFAHAQLGFDRWRRVYHHERPHEAIRHTVPAARHATSRPLARERYDLGPARDLVGYEPQDCWPTDAGTY